MSDLFEIDADALLRVQFDMRGASDQLTDGLHDVFDRFGRRVVKTAKSIVRVDTGATKRSLDYRVITGDRGLFEFEAGSIKPVPDRDDEKRILVAAINEFVHQPYMGPAFDAHMSSLIDDTLDELPEPVWGRAAKARG